MPHTNITFSCMTFDGTKLKNIELAPDLTVKELREQIQEQIDGYTIDFGAYNRVVNPKAIEIFVDADTDIETGAGEAGAGEPVSDNMILSELAQMKQELNVFYLRTAPSIELHNIEQLFQMAHQKYLEDYIAPTARLNTWVEAEQFSTVLTCIISNLTTSFKQQNQAINDAVTPQFIINGVNFNLFNPDRNCRMPGVREYEASGFLTALLAGNWIPIGSTLKLGNCSANPDICIQELGARIAFKDCPDFYPTISTSINISSENNLEQIENMRLLTTNPNASIILHGLAIDPYNSNKKNAVLALCEIDLRQARSDFAIPYEKFIKDYIYTTQTLFNLDLPISILYRILDNSKPNTTQDFYLHIELNVALQNAPKATKQADSFVFQLTMLQLELLMDYCTNTENSEVSVTDQQDLLHQLQEQASLISEAFRGHVDCLINTSDPSSSRVDYDIEQDDDISEVGKGMILVRDPNEYIENLDPQLRTSLINMIRQNIIIYAKYSIAHENDDHFIDWLNYLHRDLKDSRLLTQADTKEIFNLKESGDYNILKLIIGFILTRISSNQNTGIQDNAPEEENTLSDKYSTLINQVIPQVLQTMVISSDEKTALLQGLCVEYIKLCIDGSTNNTNALYTDYFTKLADAGLYLNKQEYEKLKADFNAFNIATKITCLALESCLLIFAVYSITMCFINAASNQCKEAVMQADEATQMALLSVTGYNLVNNTANALWGLCRSSPNFNWNIASIKTFFGFEDHYQDCLNIFNKDYCHTTPEQSVHALQEKIHNEQDGYFIGIIIWLACSIIPLLTCLCPLSQMLQKLTVKRKNLLQAFEGIKKLVKADGSYHKTSLPVLRFRHTPTEHSLNGGDGSVKQLLLENPY